MRPRRIAALVSLVCVLAPSASAGERDQRLREEVREWRRLARSSGEPLRDGLAPLLVDTVGPSPRALTPPGAYDLSVEGDIELGGSIWLDGERFVHTAGGGSRTGTQRSASTRSTV